jgi:hypothetical protein
MARLSAMWCFPSHAQQDLDAYLGIALNIAEGIGFCTPGSTSPTAYRPPLYPLLLATVVNWGWWGFCVLHLLLGLVLLLAQWRAAIQLGLTKSGVLLAVLLVAIDPLLIWYGTYPMTEPLCVALSALLLLRLTIPIQQSWTTGLLTGLLFGLCVLSRPTYWVWGAGMIALWSLRRGWQKTNPPAAATGVYRGYSTGLVCGVLLLVTPWVLRNWLMLGHPVVMTTHGGYTLLLANNPSFYAEEVEQPGGKVWRGEPFDRWSAGVQQQLAEAGIQGEVETDRFLAQQAQGFIRQHPARFLRACWHRFRMFWNVSPSTELPTSMPGWTFWCVGAGYSLWWLLAISGLWRICGNRTHLSPAQRRGWLAAIVLMGAYTLMHSVYWSNMRLRAPVVPAVALFAGAAWGLRREITNTLPQ